MKINFIFTLILFIGAHSFATDIALKTHREYFEFIQLKLGPSPEIDAEYSKIKKRLAKKGVLSEMNPSLVKASYDLAVAGCEVTVNKEMVSPNTARIFKKALAAKMSLDDTIAAAIADLENELTESPMTSAERIELNGILQQVANGDMAQLKNVLTLGCVTVLGSLESLLN